MGEVVVSSEGGLDLQMKETETEKKEDGSPASVLRWERFLPRMVLRVLLVEADDSTRQIIAALLRKCNYRVAAVPDGLKAWELVRGRPHNIDLILTEVELPSISGFALLSLITEHEICKNIPVIMMSSHDSVNMVYKCMLRGAADFLVKPIRKNELRNLWQHVWRRKTSTAGGNGPQDESVAQQKVEATAENNVASYHSSGYMACIQRNRERIEKGCDAQSSCTKPDLEAERACMENMQNSSQLKCSKSPASGMKLQKHEVCHRKLLAHNGEAGGSVAAAYKDANTMTEREEPGTQRGHANIISGACDNNHAHGNSSRGAIDLIGAFDDYPKCSYRSSGSNNGMNNFDSSPLLNLSLRRSHPSGSVDKVSDERRTLNHSDASAFSWYINRALPAPHSASASVCNQHKDYGTTSDKQVSNHTLDYNSNTYYPTLTQKSILPLDTAQSGHAEIAFPCPQQRVFPVPVAAGGVRFENLCVAYSSAMHPIFCKQSGMTPLQSPGSPGRQEPSFQVIPFHLSNPETKNIQQLNDLHDQNTKNFTNQLEQKQGQKLGTLEDRGHFSSAIDQSASSSFCNGAAIHINSIHCGSNSNVNPVPIVRASMESGNEECSLINEGKSHQSIQREAALTKFRLKRKERCYEKKVRYKSRKKLAEQRPRVKGQFVRQARTDRSALENGDHCGNSVDG